MVDKKILNHVLRMFTAGKETSIPEQAPPVDTDTQSKEQVPAETQKQILPYTRRYYYYLAPKEMSINFDGVASILNSESEDTRGEKESLIKKLQGGNTGAFHADYFQWKKLIIVTNQYSRGEEKVVAYECGLTNDGRKSAGTERVYPDNLIPARQIEADLAIYKMDGSRQIINLDTSSDSVYVNAEPPANIARLAINKGFMPQGNAEQYKDFVQMFDQYRIWVGQGNVGGLRMPDGSQPKEDDVQGGYYQGGQDVFNKVVGPALQKMQQATQQEHPLEEKSKNAPDRGIFEPVDENKTERNEGDIIDQPKGSLMAEPVKKFSFDIQRMTRSVIAQYREDSTNKDAISTGTTVKGIGGNPKTDVAEFKALATQSRTKAKKYDEMAQAMKQFQQLGTP
jgi:hypothetical protein